MANSVFERFLNSLDDGEVSWTSGSPIHVYLMNGTAPLVDSDSMITVQNVLDGPSTIVANAEITSRTLVDREYRGVGPTFPALTGAEIQFIIIAEYTATPATDRVVALFDTVTNMPFTPGGTDLTLDFTDANNRVFAL